MFVRKHPCSVLFKSTVGDLLLSDWMVTTVLKNFSRCFHSRILNGFVVN